MTKERVRFGDEDFNFPPDFPNAIKIGDVYLHKYEDGIIYIQESTIICFPERKVRKTDNRIRFYVYEDE